MAPMTATDRVATMVAVAGRDLNDELTVIVTCLAEVLAQPYVFEDEQDRKDVARLVGRWHTMPAVDRRQSWLGLRAAFRSGARAADCFIEECTEEEDFEGSARSYLFDYLRETDFIPSIEGQRVQEQRRPMIADGRITVCSSDFAAYLNKTKFLGTSPKAAASMLGAVGAKKQTSELWRA
jgi:hypothetical protein